MIIFLTLLLPALGEVLQKPQQNFYKQFVDFDFYIETGFISQSNTDLNDNGLFYQLVLKKGTITLQDVKPTDSFILWIDGGPGCSSAIGNYLETGPFKVVGTNKLEIRKQSWNSEAHIMYFDQPFQVGLSYWSKKENVDNSYDSAKYVVDALKQFFQSQPNLAKCKFYIWGESYAGHYIPVLGREIFNQGLDQLINYQGISIAGAYVAPLDQVLSASSQLFTFGVIDQFRQQQLKKITTEAIDNYNVQNNAEFLRLRDLLLFDATYIGNNYRYNIQFYDVVEDENYVNFINSHMVAFDGRRTFEPCNMDVYYAFWDDQAISVEKDILFLLDKGKVMIYNGQLDSVVNTPGALSWVNRMKWNKIDKWKQSKKQPFYFNKGLSVGGNIKQYDNFAFGVVYNAGHNTPEDQPDSNYELLKYFLSEWEKEGINM